MSYSPGPRTSPQSSSVPCSRHQVKSDFPRTKGHEQGWAPLPSCSRRRRQLLSTCPAGKHSPVGTQRLLPSDGKRDVPLPQVPADARVAGWGGKCRHVCWERGAAPGLGSRECCALRRRPGPAAAETRAAEGGRGQGAGLWPQGPDALAQAAGLEGDSVQAGLTYIWLFINAGDTR